MEFSRFLPAAELSSLIHGYWFLETGEQGEQLALVPDGYPELLFVRRNKIGYRLHENTPWQIFRGAGILGQLGGTFQTCLPPNSEVLLVKFHPWAIYQFLGVPMHLLNNTITSLGALSLSPRWKQLSRQILTTESRRACRSILNQFFLQQQGSLHDSSPVLYLSIHNIFRHHGTIGLDQLSGQINVSNRYFQRLFKDQVGISPKHYCRMIRVKRASIQMLNTTKVPLVQIAAQLNYFDQSHFLKDFKSIVGQSPSSFLRAETGFTEQDLEIYLDQWSYAH